MIWYYCIYIFALAGVPTLFIHRAGPRRLISYSYLLILAIVLALFAGLRSHEVDRDYANYVQWFDGLSSSGGMSVGWTKAPAFVLISSIVSSAGWGFVMVAIIFAAIALAMKIYFADSVIQGRWLTLFFYLIVCHTFLVDEMTEIRAAVAIPLMSIAIIMAQRGYRSKAVFLLLAAVAFHLSALIGVPVFVALLLGVRFESRGWILSLIPVAAGVAILLNSLLLLLAAFGRLNPYLSGDVDTGPIHFLSIFLWAKVGILSVILTWFWSRISAEERVTAFCAALGLALLLVLHANDNIALRASGVFGLFDLVLFMIPLKYMKGSLIRVAYAGTIVILGLAFFYSSLQVVAPYRWVVS